MTGFALTVQRLAVRDQVLILGQVAGMRTKDGWFQTSDVDMLCQELRIPKPSNTSSSLSRLRASKLLVQRSGKARWSLSPTGRLRVEEVLGEFPYETIQAELAGTPGAEYAHERHSVIPPSFAPPKWKPAIARLLEQFPFETNVFLMTRYPKDKSTRPDPLAPLFDRMRDAVRRHGLTLHLASDRQADDVLADNVVAHMWACQYGIGLLEDRDPDRAGLNSNMLIELGSMLVMGRRCKILKDAAAPYPPSDLAGQIYTKVDLDDPTTVVDAVHRWIAYDLGLGRCDHCPSDHFTDTAP